MFMKNKQKPSVNVKMNHEREQSQDQKCFDFPKNEMCVMEQKEDLIDQEEVVFDVQERIVSDEPFVFKLPSILPDEVFNVLDQKLKTSKFALSRQVKTSLSKYGETKKLKLTHPKEENKDELKMLDEKSEVCENSQNASQLLKKEEENIIEQKINGSVLLDGSGLETGANEVEKIHKENLSKISAMSVEEILKHQKQLKNCLDPSVVKFLQNKRKVKQDVFGKSGETVNQASTSNEHNKSTYKIDRDTLYHEVLRKEGKNDCDALLLSKALEQTTVAEEMNTISKNKSFDLPEETKKLLEECNKGNWKNMDKIEKEKLEWLSDLPKPNPVHLKTGYTARFDFEGKLLAHDVDVPTHKGLHHHGDEPEVAGYSLEELFVLARSSLQSQRITALHTIAHILDNMWYGMMDNCFDKPLLPIILEAGIVPLLRWALDDISATSVAATVTAIHSLLISKADEVCLHRTFCWLNGHLMPHIEPTDLEEPNINLDELTDADLIKLDVIKGFLRIDILPRFLYILQIMQPPPLVCKLIIEICSHLAQHSRESANQVTKHPNLLKLIFEKFLPLNWLYVDGSKLTDTVNYCCPSPSALTLMRIIASSSKELALYLIQNFDLVNVLTLYLTTRPVDGKLSLPDVQNVMVESLKTLYTLLCYGLGFEVFLALYPVFLRQMDFCISLNFNVKEVKYFQDFEYATHFFKALEAVVIVLSEEPESHEVVIVMNAIFKQAVVCLKKWFHQLKQEKTSDQAMTLLAAALNFASMYYKKSHKELICKDWEHCSVVKDMYSSYLIPCIRSEVYKSFLADIQSCSLLLSEGESGNKRDGKTIVSLGSVMWEGDVIPLLREGTPISLLLATLNFISEFKSFFNDDDNKPIEELLNDPSILEYLKRICTQKLNVYCWFARYETHLIALLIKMSSLMVPNNPLDWHKVAVALLPTLRIPDECLIEDLFENTIFHEVFLPSPNVELTADAMLQLPVIAKCYSSYFLDKRPVLKSRNLLFGSSKLDSVSALSNPKFLLPNDWCYAPIFDLYHNGSKKKISEQITPEDLLLITSSLQWILFCHESPLSLLNDISASVEFCYLSMVFLLDEDSFRCPKIQYLLQENMLSLLRKKKIHLSKVKSNNISSFDDLYLELLNQFEAVSYGDHLFGNFILFSLQQCYHSRWKKVLLTDHCQAITFLRVPLTKLIVPVQNFLEPYETDIEVLKDYLKLLLNGTLQHQRCPLLYLMAVHHIHNFIFLKSKNHLKSQKFLVLNITISKKEILKHQLFLYSEVDVNSEFGFVLKQELTSSDIQHLNNVIGRPVAL